MSQPVGGGPQATDGALIFHTFPTEPGHLFIEDQCRAMQALAPFPELKRKAFDRLARALQALLERGGFEVVFIESKQLYKHCRDALDEFAGQPVAYHNLYGVAVPQ